MTQFADSLHDVFIGLGPVRIRRMFGGHGVWHDDLMCALVADGTLYLKADAVSAPDFDALNLPPFTYMRRGEPAATSYRQAPEAVFEDRQQAALWTRRAFEAALRIINAKPAAKKKRVAAKKAATGGGVVAAPKKRASKVAASKKIARN